MSTQSPNVAPLVYDSAQRPHPFFEELLDLWSRRDLVAQWTARNLTLRYKRSLLGVFWALLEPLMMMVILTAVFSTAFRFPIPDFPIYLLSGLLVFDFHNRSTLQVMEEEVVSGNLAQRIHVPRTVFSVASTLSYLVHWLVALVPLFAVMAFLRHPVSWAVVSVPLGMALTAMFSLGVGLLVATAGAFFHDFKLVYQVLLMAWMYATPIIYPLEIIPEQYRILFQLNPLYHFVELVRSPVYLGEVAAMSSWLAAVLFGLSSLGIGWWTFTHWISVFDHRT